MKIAMIGHKRVPSREGGVEIVVEELSKRLVKKGYKVDIYNRKGKNVQDKNADLKNKKIKEYEGARIITIPTINKKGIDALLYSFFASIRALFGKYDVLHYHAEGSCAMLWIPHLFRKKIVVTIHGLDWQRSKWGGFASKYIKFGEKMAVKYADAIIVLSNNVQKYFKNTYNRDTYFISNGINKPTIRKAKIIKEKYGLEEDNYILFLARIVPEKGLHYLIETFNDIQTEKKLVIAGGASHTNDYLEEIKKQVEKNDKIIMTGFVQGEELEELYSNCYLYVLPSDIEGMPISLLEAMSYGKNCLVSNIEESIQVTGQYATIFEKGNVQDLKSKLIECLQSKNRFDSKQISDYILNKYNWDYVVEETEKTYEKVGDKKWQKKNLMEQ
jgi:glycosyltransferase involved in cell wall biosynthesis